MRTLPLPGMPASILMASCLLFAQQPSTAPSGIPPAGRSSEPSQHPTATLKTPKQEAWQILKKACTGHKTSRRALGIRVLGLMPNDPQAIKLAETGLNDDKPEVRSAAAAALGEMKSKTSVAKLRSALDD